MAPLSVPINPPPPGPPPVNRQPDVKPGISLTVRDRTEKKRREKANTTIASQKAASIKLRSEATKAVIEEKSGPTDSKEPSPLLGNLREHIAALRWELALNVFDQLREQLWYRPDSEIYVKLIVMLGKCKQPEKAHSLFQAMIVEGCGVNRESYTALLSAYSRNGLFDKAFSILEEMQNSPDCKPDVHTYSILIKSCVQVSAFDKVDTLLSVMASHGIKPNTVTYNTLIDAYGRTRKFGKLEATLGEMLREGQCQHDVWTMNSTLRAFGSSGQIETMEKYYAKFQCAGIQPTIETFNVLLHSYGKAGSYEKLSAVMEYMEKYYFSWTLVTYNIVIEAFGRTGNLKQMELLFRSMRSDRIKPNCVTLCSLVRAYGKARKAEKILGVLHFIENADVMLDIVFFNCLVDAYGKMGCFVEMKGVLEMMERKGCKPDGITYRTMMKAYKKGRMTSHAKELKSSFASFQKSSPGLERQNLRHSVSRFDSKPAS